MKIEDYIKSLPEKIITGEDVQLSASTLREILEFCIFFIVFGECLRIPRLVIEVLLACVLSFSVGNLIKPLQKRRRFPL